MRAPEYGGLLRKHHQTLGISKDANNTEKKKKVNEHILPFNYNT